MEDTSITSNTEPVVVKKKSRFFTKFLLIIIVCLFFLILGIVGTIYLFYSTTLLDIFKTNKTPTALEETIIPSLIPTESEALPTTPEVTTSTTTTVPATPVNTLISEYFRLAMNYPKTWILQEQQFTDGNAIPSGLPNESIQFLSSNKNVSISLELNPTGYDGGENLENIIIGNKTLPFKVSEENYGTYYYFSGSAKEFILDIPKVSDIRISMMIPKGENVNEAKEIMKGIVGSFKLLPANTSSLRTLTSTAYNFSFNMPKDWILKEQQAYPIGQPGAAITSEEFHLASANSKVSIKLLINVGYADGGEIGDTLTINTKAVPFLVKQESTATYYSFSGGESVLGYDIAGADKVSVDMTVAKGENLTTAKQILTDILNSLKTK